MTSVVKYFTSFFSLEEKKTYIPRKGERAIRTTWLRDRITYHWDTLTADEFLMQDAYLTNYAWRLREDSCVVARMLGDYYRSTTSIIEHTKLVGLNDGCGIVLSIDSMQRIEENIIMNRDMNRRWGKIFIQEV